MTRLRGGPTRRKECRPSIATIPIHTAFVLGQHSRTKVTERAVKG
ncbi:hypothetical protein [Deinococcus arcticus]|nr:hypothetical protein [Deinococcus arcticus]